MKTLYTILFFFILSPIFTQPYHLLVEEGKLWSTRHYENGSFFYPYSEYEKFSGDTSFDSYSWMKLWSTKDSIMHPWTLKGFMREDSIHQVLFCSAPGGDPWMYYDFGLSVGDTFYYVSPDIKYVLDSVTLYELYDGEFRNRYVLRYIDPFGVWDSCYDYWVEGIGSLRGLRSPVVCGMVGDDPLLICSWEEEILKYHNQDFQECFIITGIHDTRSGNPGVRFYPNPAHEFLTIETALERGGPLRLDLIGWRGTLLLTMPLLSPRNTINLKTSGIAPGLYLYRITGKGGTIQTGKLIYQ